MSAAPPSPALNRLRNTRRHIPALLDQAFVSGGNFLTIVIAAHNLSLTEQGKLGYLLSAYLVSNVINATFIFQWASFNAPRVADQIAYKRQLALVQVLLALATALLCVIGLLLAGATSNWVLSQPEIITTFFFLFFQQLFDFSRRASYLFHSAYHAAHLSAMVYLPRIGLLLALAPASLTGTAAVLLATSLAPALSTVFHATRATKWSDSLFDYVRDQPTHARWLMASGPLIWIAASAPVFMGGTVLTLEAVGVFITVRSLTNMANAAMEILETDVAARAGRAAATDKASLQQLFSSVRKFGVGVWLIGMAACYSIGAPALDLIFGPDFARYEPLLIILWTATGVNFLFRVRCVEERSMGRGQKITLAYAASSLTAVTLSYPLISWLDVSGIAWTVLFSVFTSLFIIGANSNSKN
jgi:hypothetical protein